MAGGGGKQEEPLHFLSIPELTAKYTSKQLSPVTVTEQIFQRIEATEGQLHSFVLLTKDIALEQARASAERYAAGKPLGPMDGVPVGLKDIYDQAGVVTACGCHALRDRVPTEDAHTVKLLKEQGAVLCGKTYTVEFASGALVNPQYREEVTTNPWGLETGRRFQPGGSSSGTGSSVAAGHL